MTRTLSPTLREALARDALAIHLRAARKHLIGAAKVADRGHLPAAHRELMVTVAAIDDQLAALTDAKLAEHAEFEGVAPEERS